MKDNFEQYKTDWQFEFDSLAHLQDVQNKILAFRKQRKKKNILWYSAVITFSLCIIFYVIYTDELNSIYKSISEVLLLLVSVFAFVNSWKNINRERQEYLLSNKEFAEMMSPKVLYKITFNALFTSTITVSLFLYFCEFLYQYKVLFWFIFFLLIGINMVIWLILKPILERRRVSQIHEFLSLIKK